MPKCVPATIAAWMMLAACSAPERSGEPAPAAAPTAEPAQRVAAAPMPPAPSPAPERLREVFPHVRVDAAGGVVEVEGVVPIDAHSKSTPRVYLEVVMCSADTKEHEALVMTRATASNVHAALLLAGLEPGAPGTWDWEGATIRAIPPRGPAVEVKLIEKASGREWAPAEWAVSAKDGRTLAQAEPTEGFVFAGSQMVTVRGGSRYRADAEGSIVGLTTFGGEVVAWTRMHNPDSGMEEPEWIARGEVMPAVGTEITVRIRRVR